MSNETRARSEILARIRTAIGRDLSEPPVEQAWSEIPRDYIQNGGMSSGARIDLLVERLNDYGAGVTLSSPPDLCSAIAKILRERRKRRIVVPPDIDPAWLAGNANDCTFVADDALSHAEIDACDGVLTSCTTAIAATGTLCLCHGPHGHGHSDNRPGQGRRVLTLIPDYHLCVVFASDIVETVPEAIRTLEIYRSQPITLISGPSATADIEMTRIQGVHGPRVLDVILVSSSPEQHHAVALS